MSALECFAGTKMGQVAELLLSTQEAEGAKNRVLVTLFWMQNIGVNQVIEAQMNLHPNADLTL
jgi:hypothetical protein